MLELNKKLIELTPEGNHLLLLGYCVDTFNKETRDQTLVRAAASQHIMRLLVFTPR